MIKTTNVRRELQTCTLFTFAIIVVYYSIICAKEAKDEFEQFTNIEEEIHILILHSIIQNANTHNECTE